MNHQYTATRAAPMRRFHVTLHAEEHKPRWWRRRRVTWWADSTDLPGWFAAADTEEELRALVVSGIRFHTEDKRSGIFVTYTRP
jgi:predicted RNase H-like HicB family nuclease